MSFLCFVLQPVSFFINRFIIVREKPIIPTHAQQATKKKKQSFVSLMVCLGNPIELQQTLLIEVPLKSQRLRDNNFLLFIIAVKITPARTLIKQIKLIQSTIISATSKRIGLRFKISNP